MLFAKSEKSKVAASLFIIISACIFSDIVMNSWYISSIDFQKICCRKWWRSGSPNPFKIVRNALRLATAIIWEMLARFWRQFGILLVRFGWPLATFSCLALATWLGLFWYIRPAYVHHFIRPEFLGTIFPAKLLQIPSTFCVFLKSSLVCHSAAKQSTTNCSQQPTTNNQ